MKKINEMNSTIVKLIGKDGKEKEFFIEDFSHVLILHGNVSEGIPSRVFFTDAPEEHVYRETDA